jgi:hypothetical protein
LLIVDDFEVRGLEEDKEVRGGFLAMGLGRTKAKTAVPSSTGKKRLDDRGEMEKVGLA